MAAPIWAISLAAPSLSSRAIREACRLGGTASAGAGIAADVRLIVSSPSASNTALVISSTKSGTPSVRSRISCLMLAGSGLVAGDGVNHRGDFALPEPVQGERRYVRPF